MICQRKKLNINKGESKIYRGSTSEWHGPLRVRLNGKEIEE